jgi:flagellar biosynthesis/type III secretory pathway ATPase
MDAVVGRLQLADAAIVRGALARLAATEELRSAGLADRADPEVARLIELERALDAFLRQNEPHEPAATQAALRGLAASM